MRLYLGERGNEQKPTAWEWVPLGNLDPEIGKSLRLGQRRVRNQEQVLRAAVSAPSGSSPLHPLLLEQVGTVEAREATAEPVLLK